MAHAFARIGIEDDDAAIAVAVGDVGLVGRGIDEDLRRPPQMFRVVAVLWMPRRPICSRNLPSRVNFRTWVSCFSSLPIQTLPL